MSIEVADIVMKDTEKASASLVMKSSEAACRLNVCAISSALDILINAPCKLSARSLRPISGRVPLAGPELL